MANFTFNIAKGKVAYYATLPGATDALVAVPLEAAGIEADAVLIDKDTLNDVLAGPTNEQVTMGRKSFSTATVNVDDTADRVEISMANIVWTAVPSGNAVAAIVICYKPSSSSTDAQMIPLLKYDFGMTPNGGDLSAIIPTTGLCRIS